MKKTVLLLTLYASLSASAADGVVNPSLVGDTSRVVDLDEVVIVKETYSLRRQPMSTATLSADDLTRLNVKDLRDMSQYVPAFVMPNYGSRYTSSMYVRGIGSRVNNPAVGIYVDNIPVLNKRMFNFHT